MIRKAVILLLSIAACLGLALGVISVCGASVQWIDEDWHTELLLLNGNVVVQAQRLPRATADLARRAVPSGFDWSCGADIRALWPMIKDRSPHLTPLLRRTPSVVLASVPIYLIVLVLAAYPAVASIRGPGRRWHRERRGRCIKCGYDLKGNVSGVCPECGTPCDDDR